MILQYTRLDNLLGYVDLFLWVFSVVFTYAVVLFTISRYNLRKHKTEKYQKENIVTWIIFLFLIGLANTLNIVWRFFIPNAELSGFVEFMSMLCIYVCMFVKILNIEQSINRQKFYKGYYFSIINLFSTLYGVMIYPFITEIGIFQSIYLVLYILGFLMFPMVFFFMAIKLTGLARLRALIVVFGAFLIGGGLLLQPRNVAEYLAGDPSYELMMAFFTIFCSISTTAGVGLIFLSYKKTL